MTLDDHPTAIPTVGQLLAHALRAHHDTDPAGVYDEVLRTVSARASSQGSLDKADVGALLLWKRITAQATWSRALMLTTDSEVRKVTGEAFATANDASTPIPVAGQAARNALRTLPGMGGTAALASAVLLSLAPTRMAVWDRRVGASLNALGRYPTRDGFYGQYIRTALELAGAMHEASGEGPFVPRDVDLALFHVAGNPELLDAARNIRPSE